MLGLGTVGCGTFEVLRRNANEIGRRAGRGIEVVKIAVHDVNKKRPIDLGGVEICSDPFAVVRDDSLDVIVELIGGLRPARELVLEALSSGKHVVTANKALIAQYGNEIFAEASDKGAMVAFEAAVAAGVPVIKAIREGLSGNRILWLVGIINGTGNFILSEMRNEGKSFADALARAQLLGYAEADPTYDVEGIDAAHKLTILASIAFGVPLQFDRVGIEGIVGLAPQDIIYAEDLGYRIKHLGIAKRTNGGIELRVHLALVPQKRLLANVEGVMNAVVVTGDAVGPTLYYGAGAGGEPTASAVVADLVDVVRALTADPENRVPHLAFQADALSDIKVIDADEVVTAYYLRLMVEEQVGVLAKVTQALAEHKISIEAVLQKEASDAGASVPVVLLTHRVRERDLNEALAKIESFKAVTAPAVKIRVETLD